jgi:hypothetical protein
MIRRFPFAFEPSHRAAARPFGIRPENAWVEVSESGLEARYGRWRLRTPLQNIERVELTGPYRYVKTAGPPRLGITDGGLTFGSNHRRGVLITFRSRVRAIDPAGVIRHPELTVTVEDPETLAKLLDEHIARPS